MTRSHLYRNVTSSKTPLDGDARRAPKAIPFGLTVVACLMGLGLILSFIAAEPLTLDGFTFSRVTCSVGFLVTFVGAVVAKYTKKYLDGDPKQATFTQFLALSVMSALCMMLADNLLLLVGGWAITSIGLHNLLTHYNGEADAIVAARKKFLISRLGDIALLLALVSIYRTYGSLSLTQVFEQMRASHQAPTVAVWWICLAAITKSAQFPFHTWLPDTLASPTPVSALMHAGIINGGGALLLKFSPAVVEVPSAGLFLSLVGSVTMVIGMISMWGQTSIKRKLAWSTVSQMGFMTAECGMAAFVAALIHILGHGLYKATAFLDSGTVESVSLQPSRLTSSRSLALMLAGVVLAAPLQVALHAGEISSTQWTIIAMTGLAVGHAFIALYSFHTQVRSASWTWLTMIGGSQLIALLSAVMFRVATKEFQLPLPHPSVISTISCVIPVVTLAGLSLYRIFEAEIQRVSVGRAIYIHSQNGFYIGQLADTLVSRIWNPVTWKG